MTSLIIGAPNCVQPVAALLGEGPLVDPRIGRILFLDIKGGKIFIHDPQSNEIEAVAAPGMTSALGLARSGGYVCAFRDGFARLAIEDGAVRLSPINDPEANLPGNRFNDGKVDPLGGFWAGTMDDSEKSASGAWWRLSPDGGSIKLDAGFHVTNGPAFDPARGRVFLTDSAAQTVYVSDTDGSALGSKRVFLKFADNAGYPDGMEIDSEGRLWIAFWDGACVRCFSPDGALIEEIALPVPRPTSIAFYGDSIFITSASVGLCAAAREKAPLSGGIFELKTHAPLARPPAYFNG